MPIKPFWTDNVAVIAVATLARTAINRAVLDLRDKHGARLFVRVGRGGTTALTNGVDVQARPLINNGGAGGSNPAAIAAFLSSSAAANQTTVNSDSASGQNLLNVASTTGFVAGDFIIIQDAGLTRVEWHRVSRVVSATQLALDDNLGFTHTAAQADSVRNKADAWTAWLPGGSTYLVVFDYGDDAAGDTVTIEARAQTYDQDNIT